VRRGVRSSPKESAERQLKRRPKQNARNERPKSVIDVSGQGVNRPLLAVSTSANSLVVVPSRQVNSQNRPLLLLIQSLGKSRQLLEKFLDVGGA